MSGAVKVRPLGGRVLLRRVEPKQEGRVIVPDAYRDPTENPECEVVAVGPGGFLSLRRMTERAMMPVQPGDRVMIGRWQGAEVTIDGEPFLIIESDAIVAVLDFQQDGEAGFLSMTNEQNRERMAAARAAEGAA